MNFKIIVLIGFTLCAMPILSSSSSSSGSSKAEDNKGNKEKEAVFSKSYVYPEASGTFWLTSGGLKIKQDVNKTKKKSVSEIDLKVSEYLNSQDIEQLNCLSLTINSETQKVGDWLKGGKHTKAQVYFRACKAIYDLSLKTPFQELFSLMVLRQRLMLVLPEDLRKLSNEDDIWSAYSQEQPSSSSSSAASQSSNS